MGLRTVVVRTESGAFVFPRARAAMRHGGRRAVCDLSLILEADITANLFDGR